jgi:hypothetical protein
MAGRVSVAATTAEFAAAELALIGFVSVDCRNNPGTNRAKPAHSRRMAKSPTAARLL